MRHRLRRTAGLAQKHLIFTDTRNQSRLSRDAAAGRIVRLARGVYSSDVVTHIEQQVREHLWELVAHFAPDAVVVEVKTHQRGPRVVLRSKTPDLVSFVAALRITRSSIAHQGDFPPSAP